MQFGARLAAVAFAAVAATPALAGYCPIYESADGVKLTLGSPEERQATIAPGGNKEPQYCYIGQMTKTGDGTWTMDFACDPAGKARETAKLHMPDQDGWPSQITFREVDYSASCE